MPAASFLIFYVADVPRSAAFYETLLAQQPLESSANFAMFGLSGMMLGLWAAHDVQPAPQSGAGAAELMFSANSREEVEALHQAWRDQGVTILQAPVQMDFGYTFTAVDPDGHRLRVACTA